MRLDGAARLLWRTLHASLDHIEGEGEYPASYHDELEKGGVGKAMDLPIPAAPPAMRSAGHESSLISSTSDMIDEWSVSRTTVLGVAK